MRRPALALALLMPVAMNGVLLAEVIPEVLIVEELSKENLIKEIERLTLEAEKAKEARLYDMESFYKKLKAGEGRADALAATQKEFRNHNIPG